MPVGKKEVNKWSESWKLNFRGLKLTLWNKKTDYLCQMTANRYYTMHIFLYFIWHIHSSCCISMYFVWTLFMLNSKFTFTTTTNSFFIFVSLYFKSDTYGAEGHRTTVLQGLVGSFHPLVHMETASMYLFIHGTCLGVNEGWRILWWVWLSKKFGNTPI